MRRGRQDKRKVASRFTEKQNRAGESHRPAWLVSRLEVFRRVLATLTAELASAAPALRPKGLGWQRPVGEMGRARFLAVTEQVIMCRPSWGRARIAGRATAHAIAGARKTF